MTDRLNLIFEQLHSCEVFADIGCDHGYIAKAMLDSGKCKKAIVSDISAECLKKAEKLLFEYINLGLATSVVSDGFDKIDLCDQALIAGMGGEEIVSILNRCKNLPYRLALQPMKNCDKVRLCAVNIGYKIKKDYTFKASGRFYDFILLEKGTDHLTEEEVLFGRTNLIEKPKAFIESINLRIEKIQGYLLSEKLSEQTVLQMKSEMEILKKHV